MVTTVSGSTLNRGVTPEEFGTVGDGVADDTTALQSCFDSGASEIYLENNYKVSSVSIPSTVTRIQGPGTITQSAVSNKSFTSTSDDLEILGLTFIGAATAGSASLNDDTAIEITGSENVKIHDCTFKNYSFNTVFLINCTDSHVYNNRFETVAHAIRFRGCSRCSMTGNHGNSTILISTAQSIPLGLDSTNGHAFGICEDIVIANNRFSNNPYGEGILVHGGKRVSITGNVFRKFSFGIGVNPFNATDDIQDISIVGNSFEGQNSTDWTTSSPSDADEAIFVGGSGATTRPTGVSIAGNTITHFNYVVENANQGGIVVNYAKDVSIVGNTIRDCKVNGIALSDDSLGTTIVGNSISDIVFNTGSSLKNGIRLNNASANAYISGNILSDITGTNSYGIRVDSGTARIGDNYFRSVDDEFGDFGGTVIDKDIQSYTSGTTVDVNGTDVIEFDASGGAITVGAGSTVWSNVIHNKIYTFKNVGGSNNVTISRDATYCQCDGGTDVVLTPGDSVQFIGGSAVNVISQLTKLVSNS